MRLQPGKSFDSRSPFSRADARAAGVSLAELLSPRYRRILFDVYVRSTTRVDVTVRAAAALAVAGPSSYVSHGSAAELWGAVVPDCEHVHVSVPDGQPRCERRGVKAHRARGGSGPVNLAGVAVSSPIRSLLEMAADGVGLVDLVVAGDSLLKLRRLELDGLRTGAGLWSGPGAKLAKRAVTYMRENVDSPMESRLRMLLVLAGLPEPEVNFILRAIDDRGACGLTSASVISS